MSREVLRHRPQAVMLINEREPKAHPVDHAMHASSRAKPFWQQQCGSGEPFSGMFVPAALYIV